MGSLWFTETEMVIMGVLAFTANIFLGTFTTFVPTKKIKDKKFITSNPSNNLSVIAALGTLNYVSANSNLAIEYYAYAIDLCDSFPKIADRKPDIISKLAVVFSDLGQSEKAKSLYREAITTLLLTNDSLEIEYSHYFNLGAEYLNQDSVKQSIPFFKKARIQIYQY